MRRDTREFLGTALIILGVVLYIVPMFNFMGGIRNLRCLICFILGLIGILVGCIVFWFKAEKKVISIFFSLSMAATFICFATNFSLLIASLPTIDLLSAAGLMFLILTGICLKKYCS